jgi:sulfite exporter TauE/SafE
MELWTAFGLGFLGSFHCVGMCGPIALSLPRPSSNFASLSLYALIYNFGRIATYSVFGLLFGFFGSQIALSGFQGLLSILLGVVIITGVIFSNYFRSKDKPAFYNSLLPKINTLYGKLIRKNSVTALFGMGVLNGLLPCAFVYSGLAVAVLSNTPIQSMSYMFLFGLGTLPAMFSIYAAPHFISMDLRTTIRKYLPYLAFSLGLFLIIRGIALQDLALSANLREGIETFCTFPDKNI